LVGFLTNQALNSLRFDKVFLAANAVDVNFGVTTPNMVEAETKRNMLKAGKEKILVVDHSKLGFEGLCKICDLSELDLLITDSEADEKQLLQLKKKVEVLVANGKDDRR
jgi:DeoR family fructose operon transcriptional repressor